MFPVSGSQTTHSGSKQPGRRHRPLTKEAPKRSFSGFSTPSFPWFPVFPPESAEGAMWTETLQGTREYEALVWPCRQPSNWFFSFCGCRVRAWPTPSLGHSQHQSWILDQDQAPERNHYSWQIFSRMALELPCSTHWGVECTNQQFHSA